MDWSLTKDVVSIIGTSSAVILGVIGLTTWKRQLTGTNEYELAKKALLGAYEVEQAIQSVRSPMLHLRKEEVEAGRSLEEEQNIYNERMKLLYQKWAELQITRLETKVVWSNDAFNTFNELHQRVADLRGAIWLHFWMKGAFAGPGATVDNSYERVRENDTIIYYLNDDDEFTKKVRSSIENIEQFFTPKVRKT